LNAAWSLDNRMTVVLFAGMGGGCDGLEAAGFHVHLAINHDPVAVAVHEQRHPHVRHLRCDVFEVDPREACRGRGVRVLHASPDCTHFSVAKGSKPVSKRRRSLAWVICRWAGTVRPEVITMENVAEILTWGPLVAKRDPATGRVLKLDGSVAAKGERVPVREQWLVPDRRHGGRVWRAFARHLRGLGYVFDWRVLVCADFGVPTIRKRFFGVARCDGEPIAWPQRSHAPRDKATALGLKPWVGADTIINWSLPVKSIFDRAKALADASHRRIAHGVMRHVVLAAKPYIVPITHRDGGNRAAAVDEPLRTLTTAHRGEFSLVVPTLVQSGFGERDGQAPRVLDIGEPLGTPVAGGSKAALVAAFLAQHNTGEPGRDSRDPLSTVVTLGSTQGVVAVSLTRQFGTSTAVDVRDPAPTVMVEGQTKTGIVTATLTEARGRTRGGRSPTEPLAALTGKSHAHLILGFLQHYFSSGKTDDDVRSPLGALTGKVRHGLVTVQVRRRSYVIDDIGTRMLEPEEGAAAHGFGRNALPDTITIDGTARRLTKTEKYHLVGNSVPPRMIELLAAANVRPELMVAAE